MEAIFAFNEFANTLSDTDKEKLQKLSEDFDIDDVKEFKEKVETLKESLSGFTTTEPTNEEERSEHLKESIDGEIILEKREVNGAYDGFGEMMTYL